MLFRGTTGKMVQGLKRPGIWCVDFASGSALSSPASNVVGYCLRPGSALLSYDAAGADVSLNGNNVYNQFLRAESSVDVYSSRK